MKKWICTLLALVCMFSFAVSAEESGGSWTTSNPAVAIVDGEGNVTAVGVGEADVHYTDANGNITVTHVTVVDLNCPHCGVYVDASNAADHALCLSCNMYACQEGYDELDHERIISGFCNLENQHRACAPDRMHHCEHCGEDYDCSLSGSHTECKMCKLPWCDKTSKGNHKTPDCGNDNHRPCMLGSKYDEDDHEWCRYCKKYKCKTSSKVKHGNDKGECGYKEPEVKKCSGCGETGVQHTETCWACGTLSCKPNWTHNHDCDHCFSKTDAAKHALCACGESHLCWGWAGHGKNECSAAEADPEPVPEIYCGGCETVVDSANAHVLTCGHYSCQGGEHGTCSHCGNPVCNGDSHGIGQGQCGYVEPECSYCGASGTQHNTAACGNHCVNQSGEHERCSGETGCSGWRCDGRNHDGRSCDHCAQVGGDHSWCSICDEGFNCWGSHGEGICNAQ